MMLAWGSKVSPAFRDFVVNMAQSLACDPSHLMACIAFETGHTFRPDIRNAAGSGAVGEIQIMPRTAIGLGTTADLLAAMSAEDQLRYVYAYLRPYAGRLTTLADVYMAILMPTAIGKPEAATLISDAEGKVYIQNKGLDLNQDGNITKAEAAAFVQKALEEGLQPQNAWDMQAEPNTVAPPATEGKPVGALLSTILPLVLQQFSGRAQATIAQTTAANPAVETQLFQMLLNKIGEATGLPVATPAQAVQAVAAITTSPDPAKVKALEESALAYLDHLAPLLDKMADQELAAWRAIGDSADRAAARGRGDAVDIAPRLVTYSAAAFGAAFVCIVVLMGVQMWLTKDARIDPTLAGFLGLFTYGVIRMMDRPSAYRFGGAFESQSVDTTKAVVNQALSDQARKVP